jgi:SAM-dependent methyltransferase
METRKQKEIEYYDRQAEEMKKGEGSEADFEGFNPLFLSSFRFCYEWLKNNCQDKKVLDYGCGNGIHSIFLAKTDAEKVTAIDLSDESLKIAREKAKHAGLENRIEFLKMDCEKMEFPDNSFDVIFDGGTFSSLDLKLALPELARVLKPEGRLLGIETFGHNPLTNLKRKINKITGKRTGWAADHIFKTKDLKYAQDYFGKIDVHYFHLVSWLAFPFLNLAGGKLLLNILEIIDKILSTMPFLRRYAFKVVFIFSLPKK